MPTCINFKAKGSFAVCGMLSIVLLITTCNITEVDASSFNKGQSMGPPPIGNVNTAAPMNKAAEIDYNDRSNIIPNSEKASHVAPGTNLPERGTATDIPITDAASALAAKYAAASIVTGDFLPSNVNNAKPGNDPSESNSSGGGGWFGKILGKSSASSSDNGQNPIVAQGGKVELPPPPPPPPLSQITNSQQQPKNNQWNGSGQTKQQQLQQHSKLQQQHTQQPPPPNSNYNPYAANSNYPPYNPSPSYIDPAAYQNLLYELDESTLREMTLTHQLHNLSAYVDTLTSESENLVMRIDVLTERLADTNANFNFVHNRNLELDANCTQLASTVASLREEIAGYESKMANMEEEKGENEKILVELRGELRRVTDELEQLACLVETERFEMEKGEFLRDFKKKGSKRRKKRGFWAWLFGFESDEKEDDYPGEEQERLRAAQELARSTLLHALQTERSSVEELEAAVITLQRNNSAIMDVVQSRNSLINELNDRVAVFEEDKMVLKAALRQLQKEIREEGPKLEKAQEGERRLREELDRLKLDYQEELEDWQQRLEDGEAEWNQTKEELFLIGTYVDQLEDRLATFAIAKKEIEAREKKCQELEAEAKKHAKEAESWKSQVEALAKEQGETKPLLEDLVKERAEARVKMDGLLNEIKELNGQIEVWKQKVEEAEQHGQEIKSQSARQLFLRIEENKREWEADTARQIDEQKRLWDAANTEQWKKALETEKETWHAQRAQEFEHQLAQEKASWENNMQECQSQLETRLVQEWNAKLVRQRIDLETHFQQDLQDRLDLELSKWQEQKEHEIQQSLSEERASWEAELPLNNFSNSLSLEDEVERAATKVYDKLEKNGVSFGVTKPLDSVHDLLGVADDFEDQSTSDVISTSNKTIMTATDLTIMNGTMQNITKAQKSEGRTRSIPFRTARKAFSRATGIHGFITPSSVQLRQRSMRSRRQLPKKATVEKQSENADSLSYKDDSTTELSVSQVSTDAEVENQVWDESETIGEVSNDISTGSDGFYQTDHWNYESDGGVELMSLVEPPPLPDFDDR